MILDSQNLFSKDQAVTATATAPDVVDLGTGDIGPSERISLFVTASKPYTGAGDMVVELQTSDEVTTGGALVSPVVVARYAIANAALLEGGKLVAARLPHGMKRYAGVAYTVNGSIAGGAITACLVLDAQASEFATQPE